MPEQHDVELGDIRRVCGIVGISKSEVHRRRQAGNFPEPVRLGTRCTRWNLPEVRAWVAEQLAKRDQKRAA